MPAPTPAYAKNIIRRAFSELVDPSPKRKEMDAVWEHFGDACAYCESVLKRGAKQGHIDHLVSASQGGSNAMRNRVLSCARCNEIEKLDRPWEDFLRSKCKDEADFHTRRRRILEWQHIAVSTGI